MTALVVGLASTTLSARDCPEDGDPDAFEKSLTRVSTLYERGRADAGLEALQELLEEHAKRPYARARRVEIEDLARRLAFRAAAVIPDPKTLVSGKLLKWDGRSGKIKIEYTIATRDDLEKSEGGVWYLPMDLRGPTTLEIEGKYYPGTTDDCPEVFVGGGHNEKRNVDESYRVIFGTPPYAKGANEAWMPVRFVRYDDDQRVLLCERDITPAKAGEAYTLKVKIASTSIQASINKKSIGKMKKTRDLWGYLGFRCKGWDTVTLAGAVEPSWLQSLVDAALGEQREEFDRNYDRSKVLPDWLFEEGPDASPVEDDDEEDLPERIAERHWPLLTKLYAAIEDDDHARALPLIAELREAGAPGSTCAYIEGMVKRGMGRYAEGLRCAELCVELAPDFADGHMLRGALLRRLGRNTEAVKAYRQGIAAGTRCAYPYEIAALDLMMGGDFDEACGIARLAARNGVISKRMDLVNTALIKARRGPNWPRRFEHKSTNYHVISDIDKKTCIEASKVLEQAFAAYRLHIGWVRRDRSWRFRVFLFGGRAGFLQYQKDMEQLMGSPSVGAAGLYSPLLKQLLIWNLPNRDEMYATIRHEGFHQYLDRFLPDPPTWFNEGLAVYHEDAESKAGRLEFGQVQRRYVELLEKNALTPLCEFLVQPDRKFYESGHFAYAQAWAFIHMLRHGSGDHKSIFRALVKELKSNEPPMQVLARLLPEDRLTALDEDLAAYVKTLGR